MRSILHEGAELVPAARTLWEIQRFAEHPPVETASNLYIDVLRQARNALHQGEERRFAAVGIEAFFQYRQQVRKEFLDCIGGLPANEENAPVRVVKRQTFGGFVLESILLPVGQGSLVSANLYLPRCCQGRRPAVLVVVGHTDQGKADPEYQYLAQALVHSGFVTLVLDPLGEGERFEHYEAEMDFQPIQGCSGEHDLLDWKCKLMGLSLARYFIRDGIAALDYLASREEVDPNRIALTGHSGGGTQTSMLMLAAGERFACAAPCTYITDVQAMMDCGVDPDNEMIWPGSLAKGLDYIDFLAGMAPKPVLLLTVQHDFFPREGTLRTLESARRLWMQAGDGCMPEMVTVESQHSYTPKLAQAAADFFSRHLLGQPADLSSFAFERLPDQTLWCTSGGILLKEYPQSRTLHQELTAELLSCRMERESLSVQDIQKHLSDALHMERLSSSPDDFVCRVYHEGICGHYTYQCLVWRPQDGYWNNGVLLRDMRLGDKPLPTVIALWPEGLSRLAEHSGWIHRTVWQGWQVLVMDVTASGSLLPSLLGSTMYIGWGTMFKLNAYLIQLQDSLFALRTRQAAAAVRMLEQWSGANGPLRFYGQGEFSRYAVAASLLTGVPACVDGDCQPYEEIVRERYHDQTHTHEWVFPGMLRYINPEELWQHTEKLQARDPAEYGPEEPDA